MGRCRVLIVDDQTLLRQLLSTLLRVDSQFEVVGESGRGDEAIPIALKLKPDLIVLDVYLPGLLGVEVQKHLKEKLPKTKFLMITGNESMGLIRTLMQLNVEGIIEKSAPLEHFKLALRSVKDGERYYGEAIKVLMRRAPREEAQNLSKREAEVLELISKGCSTKQISANLQISFKTADNHRTNLMRKLEVHDVVTLLNKARELGLTI